VWDANSGGELAVLRGHESSVKCVAYSPDGQRIVSGSGDLGERDNTVRVWDVRSGAELAVLGGHKGWVNSVSYNPDGRRIASGSGDGTVRIWDAASGAEMAVLQHSDRVSRVSYSPDGRRIVSGCGDSTVRVLDAESGAELAVLRERTVFGIQQLSCSADSRRILIQDCVGIWEWDLTTDECVHLIQGWGDVAAIAAGAPRGMPWRAIRQMKETVIQPAGGGDPVAWFPVALEELATHPSGRAWAGSRGIHLYIISLEGEPETAEGKRES
jgi:WD40 repeat protein